MGPHYICFGVSLRFAGISSDGSPRDLMVTGTVCWLHICDQRLCVYFVYLCICVIHWRWVDMCSGITVRLIPCTFLVYMCISMHSCRRNFWHRYYYSFCQVKLYSYLLYSPCQEAILCRCLCVSCPLPYNPRRRAEYVYTSTESLVYSVNSACV